MNECSSIRDARAARTCTYRSLAAVTSTCRWVWRCCQVWPHAGRCAVINMVVSWFWWWSGAHGWWAGVAQGALVVLETGLGDKRPVGGAQHHPLGPFGMGGGVQPGQRARQPPVQPVQHGLMVGGQCGTVADGVQVRHGPQVKHGGPVREVIDRKELLAAVVAPRRDPFPGPVEHLGGQQFLS